MFLNTEHFSLRQLVYRHLTDICKVFYVIIPFMFYNQYIIQHKHFVIHHMTYINSYMFRHRGAIVRQSL